MKDNKITLSDFIGFSSISAFIVSVTYIFGFSNASGIMVFKYFSFEDYLRFAIEWITPVVIAQLIFLAVELLNRRIERGLSEDEIIATSSNPSFFKEFRKSPDVFFKILIFLIVILRGVPAIIVFCFYKGNRINLYGDLRILSVFAWFLFFDWYTKVPRLIQNWDHKIYWLFLIGPSILLYSFTSGLYFGECMKYNKYTKPPVEIKISNIDKPLNGNLVFLLDNYCILSNSGKLSIYHTDKIDYIKELIKKDKR